jgi:hypothetical protein
MIKEISCLNALTLERVCELNEEGYEFVIENGVITDVIHG